MPVLQKGCCCAELETWAAIVGWLGVVFSIFNIFGYFAMGYHWIDIIIYVIIGIAHLIVSALLIKATKNRKANFVTPWLVVFMLEIIATIILTVLQLLAAQQHNIETSVATVVITLCCVVAVFLYFWLCIYSYYQQLSNQ